MARKKNKQPAGKQGPSTGETPRSSISPSSSNLSSSTAGIASGTPSISAPPTSTSSRKSSAKSSAAPSSEISPPLLISRNKHWKFISCFHGSWLQMPFEVLEAIAHINYNTVLPRPVDSGCLFDILKVRRLFEEATSLAVRAASDIASPMLTNVNAGFRDPEAMGCLLMGAPPAAPHGARLSKERKFRMREQACQKLARAYRLDEIACSVATMQGASPLEDIGKLVLQRSPADPDARYVDFFHEKIPSRRVAQSTSLLPLTDILSDRPEEPEVLRTRALVKVFKRDYDGAVQDLTHALSVHRFVNPASHTPQESNQKNAPPQGGHPPNGNNKRRPNDVLLTEKEQPSSFESQILFQRATAYFSMACEHVRNGMPMPSPPPPPPPSRAEQPSSNGPDDAAKPLSTVPGPAQGPEKQAESRRLAKHFARRAIKDYMAFISRFHYSPNYPIKAIQEYTDRVTNLTHSTRTARDASITLDSHAVYPLSELFAAAAPPENLPPFPPPNPGPDHHHHPNSPRRSTAPPVTTCEWLTFHPLITDVLHSLLLCHLLVQTPAKELQRHAYMAARLVRLADGFPIFQASRSPSRADWLEVLRRAGNWLRLADSWENLTSPFLIPFFCTKAEQHKIIASASHLCPVPPAVLFQARIASPAAAPKQPEQHAMQDHALSQTYNTRKTTLHNIGSSPFSTQSTTATANLKTTEPKPSASPAPTSREKPAKSDPPPLTYEDTLNKWIAEDSREHPILADRAAFLTRWLQEAPAVAAPSTGRRKKRPARPSQSQSQSRPKDMEGSHSDKRGNDTNNGKEKNDNVIGKRNVLNDTVEALAGDIGRLNV
ncbi:hypothetical protein ESCO_004699 [Escovopsis weberi]|uniref:Uncharacterized protein n=1 Tax=Escovopsis weberi TaxID=150374 RepID=A0A0M9VRN5_ESCWE|nr:hypothetical protein ESCO_004699 [Escovopsis weberi]